MAKTKVAMELGMGTSLRRQDYTKAAIRALQDALWHNSLTMADAFGFSREDMIVEVEIGVQKPEAVDIEAVKAESVPPRGCPRSPRKKDQIYRTPEYDGAARRC